MSESATTGRGARQGVALDFTLSLSCFFVVVVVVCLASTGPGEHSWSCWPWCVVVEERKKRNGGQRSYCGNVLNTKKTNAKHYTLS